MLIAAGAVLLGAPPARAQDEIINCLNFDRYIGQNGGRMLGLSGTAAYCDCLVADYPGSLTATRDGRVMRLSASRSDADEARVIANLAASVSMMTCGGFLAESSVIILN